MGKPLWLEPVLERHLVQVAAPDELWNRIRNPQRPPVPTSRAPLFLLAATALLVAAAWSVLPRHTAPASAQDIALDALSRGPEDLDLRSDTVTEIRAWVKSRTGLDIPLPARTSPVVRLAGVCAVKGGTPTFEVAYRVSGHNAALLVSKAGPASSPLQKHHFLKCESIGGKRVSSWIMRGQLYTLAYAGTGNNRDECLLCHIGAQQLPLSN